MDGVFLLAIVAFIGYRVFQSVQQNQNQNMKKNMKRNEKLSRGLRDVGGRTKRGANAAFDKPTQKKTAKRVVEEPKPAVSQQVREPVSEEFSFQGAWDEELVDLVARNKKMEAVELLREHTAADFDKALGAVNLVKGGLSPDEAVAWIEGKDMSFEELSTVEAEVEPMVEEIIEAIVES